MGRYNYTEVRCSADAAAVLQQAFKDSGYTLKELAARSQMSEGKILHCLKAERGMDISELCRLASALGAGFCIQTVR